MRRTQTSGRRSEGEERAIKISLGNGGSGRHDGSASANANHSYSQTGNGSKSSGSVNLNSSASGSAVIDLPGNVFLEKNVGNGFDGVSDVRRDGNSDSVNDSVGVSGSRILNTDGNSNANNKDNEEEEEEEDTDTSNLFQTQINRLHTRLSALEDEWSRLNLEVENACDGISGDVAQRSATTVAAAGPEVIDATGTTGQQPNEHVSLLRDSTAREASQVSPNSGRATQVGGPGGKPGKVKSKEIGEPVKDGENGDVVEDIVVDKILETNENKMIHWLFDDVDVDVPPAPVVKDLEVTTESSEKTKTTALPPSPPSSTESLGRPQTLKYIAASISLSGGDGSGHDLMSRISKDMERSCKKAVDIIVKGFSSELEFEVEVGGGGFQDVEEGCLLQDQNQNQNQNQEQNENQDQDQDCCGNFTGEKRVNNDEFKDCITQIQSSERISVADDLQPRLVSVVSPSISELLERTQNLVIQQQPPQSQPQSQMKRQMTRKEFEDKLSHKLLTDLIDPLMNRVKVDLSEIMKKSMEVERIMRVGMGRNWSKSSKQ